MSGVLLSALALVGAALAWNVHRPIYAPVRPAILSFLLGWLVGELALHHAIAWGVATAVLVGFGALESTVGVIGFWLTLATIAALLVAWAQSFAAGPAVERGLFEGLGPDYEREILPEIAAGHRRDVSWRNVALPFSYRDPEVERIRDVRYRRVRGINLKLDVYRHRSRPRNCPVLLEVHGGGWILGSKNEQGIPLMVRMAKQGWLCVAADYRLSPHATFPEHLIDLKHALRWIHEHGPEHGGDPSFVVVAGQSAGGHLASMVALTANDAELQPGFESLPTRVAGCVSFYGVYDFTDRRGVYRNDGLRRILERKVMKASLEEDREAYVRASPCSHVDAGAPPFLVVHSDRDTLVPVEEARRFVEDLREKTTSPVVYVEIPGAQHAFEIFHSVRSELTLSGIERFLGWLDSRRRKGEPAIDPADRAPVG